MKVKEISETERQLVLETGDSFKHEIGASGWSGRLLLALHFLRVAWSILRRGKAVHSIHGGQDREAVEDILDAEVIGD